VRNQERLEGLLAREPRLVAEYERWRASGHTREDALLALWDDMANDVVLTHLWPKGATFRVATDSGVRTEPLSVEERREGIASGPFWVPFEKGDQSQEVVGDDGKSIFLGARWTRENPLVIDWSRDSVELLRRRARGSSSRRRPRLQNEGLWFTEGVTWNSTSRYVRFRQVPKTAIFGHKTPLIISRSDLLMTQALLALVNSQPVEFLVRTFLGSLMQTEIGDVRRIPIPILSQDQNERLAQLAQRAVNEKHAADAGDPNSLSDVEAEIDAFVRDLYGVPRDAELWVVR
jgi:hypothetical protein